MLEWARGVGRNLGMVLTIRKSWDTKLIVACENFGKFETKKKGDLRTEPIKGTKKKGVRSNWLVGG